MFISDRLSVSIGYSGVTLASEDTYDQWYNIYIDWKASWTQRRCPKCWECWSPCVSQGPAGALQWGLDHDVISSQFMLLRDHIGARPSPLLFPVPYIKQTFSPHPRTNQRESRSSWQEQEQSKNKAAFLPQNQPKNKNKARRRKGECQSKTRREQEIWNMKNNFRIHVNISFIDLWISHTLPFSWTGDKMTRSDSGGTLVTLLVSGKCQGNRVRASFFVQFHFGWYHATIPHDRVFILLLPHCHTQLDGRSNSMLGARNIKPCLLLGE